jgi:uncharacterized delta-60 repeat protein
MNLVDDLSLSSNVRENTLMQPRNRSLGTVVWIAILACTTFILSPTQLMAQAGQLDASFATGGVFTTTSVAPFQTGASAVALQSDGKIVVAGKTNGSTALLRLTTSGNLDPTFGNGGIAKIPLPPEFFVDSDVAVGVAVQPDGKIVFAIRDDEGDAGIVCHIVSRVNADGSLDTAFGNGGFGVSSTQNTRTHFSIVLALQPDGKILVAGSSIARFDATGQLDPNFGTGGLAAVKNFAGAMVVQPNGQILIATGGFLPSAFGTVPPASNSARPPGIISRYNPDGSLDSNFGIFGQAATVAPTPGVLVQSDGKIVMAGPLTDTLLLPPRHNTTGFGLLRYNPDGSIDTGFGAHGGVLNSFGSSAPFASANALVQQPDGRLIVAGDAGDENSSNFALARYTSDGNLDGTFGSGGQVITAIPNNRSTIVALALQSDGNIIAVGNLGTFDQLGRGVMNIAVARYLGQ